MTDSEITAAINKFKNQASPSSSTHGDPATVDDVNKVIEAVATLFKMLAKQTR